MSRHPDDPSGAKRSISIKLSPRHLERLETLTAQRETSRSKAIAWLLDKLKLPGDTP